MSILPLLLNLFLIIHLSLAVSYPIDFFTPFPIDLATCRPPHPLRLSCPPPPRLPPATNLPEQILRNLASPNEVIRDGCLVKNFGEFPKLSRSTSNCGFSGHQVLGESSYRKCSYTHFTEIIFQQKRKLSHLANENFICTCHSVNSIDVHSNSMNNP